MRYINAIFTAAPGDRWSNQDIFPHFERTINAIAAPKPEELIDVVRYFLMGKRTRMTVPNWLDLRHFDARAEAFETGAERALDLLVKQIIPAADAAGIVFDGVVTTTSTGNLMPGLSYRLAHRLGHCLRVDSALIDLGNVGCTGGLKALHLVNGLDASYRHVLVVSVELPTTLINWAATDVDVWQGNCTFGDGAAALWVSLDIEQGEMALALDTLCDRHQVKGGLDLIHWGYEGYYTFRLANKKEFDRDVRDFVGAALRDVDEDWLQTPHWAIHPAGIALLMRLSRKLGLPRDTMQASIAHYTQFSNMSSASILHILKTVSADAPIGAHINLLTMGAGFDVIYGRVRKER
jgi:alkylresorcinol/alkylpyrone synthase